MKLAICTLIGLAAAASLHAQVNPSFVAVERYDTPSGITRLQHFPMGERWRSVIMFFVRRNDWPSNAPQNVELDTQHNVMYNRLTPARDITLVQIHEFPMPVATPPRLGFRKTERPRLVVSIPKAPRPTRTKPRKILVAASASSGPVQPPPAYVGTRL